MFLFWNPLDRDSHRLHSVASFCPEEWLRGDRRGSVVIVWRELNAVFDNVTGQLQGRMLPQGELSANPSGTFGGFL